jgi:hypothetical protein
MFDDGKLATSQMGSRLWCSESVRPIYYLLMVGRCKHIISFHIFIPENESKYGFYRLSLISEKHGMHCGLKTIFKKNKLIISSRGLTVLAAMTVDRTVRIVVLNRCMSSRYIIYI